MATICIPLLSTEGVNGDESAAQKLQTDAYDDEGMEDEVDGLAFVLEGPAIDHERQSSLCRVLWSVNANNSKNKEAPFAHEAFLRSQEHGEYGSSGPLVLKVDRLK